MRIRGADPGCGSGRADPAALVTRRRSPTPPRGRAYGADVGTHPEYRRRGIARGLYAARHDTVRRLGLKGQVTVGMPSGFGAVKDRMSADAYFEGLKTGAVRDPTISAQMKVGFEPVRLLPNYLDDPVCDNYGVLIVLSAQKDV